MTENIDDFCSQLLKAKPTEEIDKGKVKWRKRRKIKISGRRREAKKVSYHPGTKEARQILEQANRIFIYCEECGTESSTQIHHIDGNPFNNAIDNLKILCQNCHAKTHGLDEAEVIDEYEGVAIVDE